MEQGELVGIRPNHLLATTLSLFRQGEGYLDYAYHKRKIQLHFYPFRRAWLRNRILCENLFTYYEWQAGASPQKSKAEILHCWSTLQKLE